MQFFSFFFFAFYIEPAFKFGKTNIGKLMKFGDRKGKELKEDEK